MRDFVSIPFNTVLKDEVEFIKSAEKVLLTQFELAPKAIKNMGNIVFGQGKLSPEKMKLLEFLKNARLNQPNKKT